jgi:hypothetical protein
MNTRNNEMMNLQTDDDSFVIDVSISMHLHVRFVKQGPVVGVSLSWR